MYPEDRVLIGVIKSKRDLTFLRNDHWYRIPQEVFPRGVHTEYLGFFLSGSVFQEQSGAVHYYAPYRGVELRYRRELIPTQPMHTRANKVYYKIALGDVLVKSPPIVNTTKRAFSFIFTTWDRFVEATSIPDLYSESEHYVDRIYHALRERGITPTRTWENQNKGDPLAPSLNILCQTGAVVASPMPASGAVYMDAQKPEDAILNEILMLIAQNGGAVTLNVPVDGL